MNLIQNWESTFIIAACMITPMTAQAAKVLKMAANLDSEPFIYIDRQGKITGFEVELIQSIGKMDGFTVSFTGAAFPQVFDDLKEKKIDLIGHVYNDAERKAQYHLTTPHYIDRMLFLTLKDKQIDKFPPEDNKAYSVATLAFSPLEEEFLDSIQPDYPDLKMHRRQTTFLGFKDLFVKSANSSADILLTTRSSIDHLTKRYAKFDYNIFPLPKKYQQDIEISFLTLKDDNGLADDLNDGLQTMKENGTYKRLKEKYKL